MYAVTHVEAKRSTRRMNRTVALSAVSMVSIVCPSRGAFSIPRLAELLEVVVHTYRFIHFCTYYTSIIIAMSLLMNTS